eukprot:jgi/Mesvir1/8858/Mv02753-RA.1
MPVTEPYESGPPWKFTGKALYQLTLVPTKAAREFIPPQLKIVSMFGYTLGGLYYAHYDSSPAGTMDELVVLAGIVWNPPTSCAWAGRVFVDRDVARVHGIRECGLPSRLASFKMLRAEKKKEGPGQLSDVQVRLGIREQLGSGSASRSRSSAGGRMAPTAPVCEITMPSSLFFEDGKKLSNKGPKLNMSLPSFSGFTAAFPEMLKYSCAIKSNIRFVKPVTVARLKDEHVPAEKCCSRDHGHRPHKEAQPQPADDALGAILYGKPVVSMLFDNMEMSVERPQLIPQKAPSRWPNPSRLWEKAVPQ